MASALNLQLHTVTSFPLRFSKNVVEIKTGLGFINGGYKWWWNRKIKYKKFVVRANNDDDDEEDMVNNNVNNVIEDDAQLVIVDDNEKGKEEKLPASKWRNVGPRFQETVGSFPPVVFLMKRQSGTKFAIGLCIATTLLIISVRGYMARKKKSTRPGSVADLVRRGQLSDRRGISSPLKYEDPFNNPMVKISKNNSTVEMCGKVYRLAPVSLTIEQQAVHKKRRSRAYQWKRPTIFLREGDPVPPDVDPDTIRWIPANHPFATTVSDIDEGLAQTNVYQKHGVPFRIQAEHEALQKRLESLQNDQKLGKLVIDPGAAKEFERPFKSNLRPEDTDEQNPFNGQVRSNPTKSDLDSNSLPKKPASEDIQKP